MDANNPRQRASRASGDTIEPAASTASPRGPDPDSRARTHLANERTFLAWLRTGLGMILLGLGSSQLIDRDHELGFGVSVVGAFGVFVVLAGTATVLLGASQYARSRDRIESESYRPAGRSVAVAAALVALGGLLAITMIIRLDGL